MSNAVTVNPNSEASAFAPLRHPAFRFLWMATIASNVGTWVHDVGASWLMLDLSSSPLQASLVQTASTAPFFLIGLPAGVLADLIDRRKLLLLANTGMLLCAGSLAFLSYSHLTTPVTLLVFTFLMGTGTALNAPAWAAIVPDLVPKNLVPPAVALNGISVNVARSVGPALGGALVASNGPWAAFALNAVSFFGVVIVLITWRPERPPRTLPGEGAIEAFATGIRHITHSSDLRRVLGRAAAFVLPASALWALLPIFARQDLGLTAGRYGFLLGIIGLGAIGGVFIMPKLRSKLGANRLVFAATCAMAAALGLLAVAHQLVLIHLIMIPVGICWLAVLTSMNAAAQSTLPSWVRARGLSAYLLIFFGGMALGSTTWGAVASTLGVREALGIAAAALAVGAAASWLFPIPVRVNRDLLEPSHHWRDPVLATGLEVGADTAVLVEVTYHIDEADVPRFLQLMSEIRESRMRNGATHWWLYRDSEQPRVFVEHFRSISWEAHQREHARVNRGDHELETEMISLHRLDAHPVVRHFLQQRPRR